MGKRRYQFYKYGQNDKKIKEPLLPSKKAWHKDQVVIFV